MYLYLIRHTAPLIPAGICYGQTDVPMSTDDIVVCAETLRRRWSGSLPVFTSPLSRCLNLANHLHPNPVIDERLLELHFGEWEMQAWDLIPRDQIDAWAADVVGYSPGKRETLLQMVERVMAFIADLQKQSMEQAVIVSHAGVIRILAAWQQGDTVVSLAKRVAQMEQRFEFASCTETTLL